MTIEVVTKLSELDKILATKGKLTVIDFHAVWCGPCKAIAPKFKELSEKYKNVNFVKVDVDEAQEVAKKYNITAMPTFVFVKDSVDVHRVRGANASALSAGVEEYSGEGSKAGAFTGKGYVLGDGSSTTPPRTLAGNLEIGTELKIFLALIAGYLLLMYYSKNPI